MEEALEMLQRKDTKQRMAGVDKLQQVLEHSRKPLTPAEVGSFVDASLVLLKDNNFRISQGALQALALASPLAGEHLKVHLNVLLPAVVERLGDGKQPVRDAARRLLLSLMEISSPTSIVERAGSYAWIHKNWRVREEFARAISAAIRLFASTEHSFQPSLLPSVLQLLEDSNKNAREAAMVCLEELYRQGGTQFHDEIQRHPLRPAQLKEINIRFERIHSNAHSVDEMSDQVTVSEFKSSLSSALGGTSLAMGGSKRSSPKAKPVFPEASLAAGDHDITEKPVDPIKVSSEKELAREIEKISGMLTPEQEWSVRITAMQQVEGLVFGGASSYACFSTLMKQLVGPLSVQLTDRRSSIVKQACHLLNLLSKELKGDFEACAESFIPVLFKLVVITVLVIAESADNCIKTMLRNCKVARVLPRIIDCAKHDRSAVLRARCCEYALLVLEHWVDASEIQRSADLYEDLIKCCVGDAMSEVRSLARACYRMAAKIWPERSRRLFAGFDVGIQRLINEEEGGCHKRYASPSSQQVKNSNTISAATSSRPSGTPVAPGHGMPAVVPIDRTSSLPSGVSFSSSGNHLTSQRKPPEQFPEGSLDSVLKTSQQQVNTIENMLKGVDTSEKGISSSLRPVGKDTGGSYRKIHASACAARVGVDPPSARDPPHPATVSAPNQVAMRISVPASLGIAPNIFKGAGHGGSLSGAVSDGPPAQVPVLAEVPVQGSLICDPLSAPSRSYSAKRIPAPLERLNQNCYVEESNDFKAPKRVPRIEPQMDKFSMDGTSKDVNSVPNFQRTLLRGGGSVRSSASSRSSVEENYLPTGEMYNYMDGLMSLSEALTEGLSVGADWSARVAAFNYLRKLLQQGPRGLQEVAQNFEKVMKFFSEHLDDPHHKVAQAALTTLVEVVTACRKSFEGYLERILPSVFSRLVDPKEVIRQLCASTLETVGNNYGIDSLFPALLRSLDEQRSPKAKMAVIEFAIAAFAKLAISGEATGGSSLLKLWLAKLAPLANDRNPKLRETAVNGIISVYSHFDSANVLNFILGLSIEEQSTLRRALKQYTPRIEVDLMNFLQNRSQRIRSKSLHDQSDVPFTNFEEVFGAPTRENSSGKVQFLGRYFPGSVDCGSGRKWSSAQDLGQHGGRTVAHITPEESQKHLYRNQESSLTNEEVHVCDKSKDSRIDSTVESDTTLCPRFETRHDYVSPHQDGNALTNREPVLGVVEGRCSGETHLSHSKSKKQFLQQRGPHITALLDQICNGNDDKSVNKRREALRELVQISRTNDVSLWSQFFNQIFSAVLETLSDNDSVVRELALSVIHEMLNNQRKVLEDSVGILLGKLLQSAKDFIPKVSSEADRCLSTILSEYDPHQCLMVIIPLLVSKDEKTLVNCISCLTKLVGRLPAEDLMAQLPSFLPALFDAFGNQSADVRKTVVFCLVDIYIVLGKAFLPYLGSLSSTQLRLVTIYANRISQARSGAAVDANHV